MRLLVPLATSALIAAAAISATAAVPAAPVPHVAPSPSARPALGSPTAPAVRPALGPSTAPAPGSAPVPFTGAAPGGAATQPARRGGFTWPSSPRPAVLRHFERPQNQWSPGHRGVDLSASVGQPVLSAGEGVVAFSGVIASRGVVTVRHSGGLRTTYEPVDARLTVGTLVHRGASIGLLSSTAGHCVPLACLHWGAIFGQAYRDPLLLLGFGRPILLPLG